MKYADGKIVYEAGDWVTRITEEHLGMEPGDTDVITKSNSSSSFKLKKFRNEDNVGCHCPDYFRPATQSEIDEAMREPYKPLEIAGHPVIFNFTDNVIKVGCYSIDIDVFKNLLIYLRTADVTSISVQGKVVNMEQLQQIKNLLD